MALDVRAGNDAVVDHVGIGDPLDPRQFVQVVGAAKWTSVGRVLELNVECRHPAIDFALRDLVTEANRILTEVTGIIVEVEELQAAAKDLPGQLSPGEITPAIESGKPAYTTPHQQFTLAQNEVRELLMGDELYGDPDLAIREMYQNALDACRYRKARLNFLGRSGKRSAWKGKIVFRQGFDRGRQYVECEDNGIGMGTYEIESCFSRAGKRFADLPEFIEEQELWLQCTPKIEMTPNSQFGIGVLSYFMIADEIEVITCRLDREGHPGKELSIRIPGGGTLFRVQPTGRTVDAGTRIRLYLREDWNKSCCDILERLLFIAEFETEAADNTRRLTWQPGVAPGRYIHTNSPDFWWTSDIDGGQVLADGIATDLPGGVELGVGNQPFGALINLRNDRRPKLTVDRKQILEFDEAWLLRTYSEGAASLVAAPWLRLSWLWRMPEKIQRIMEPQLVDADASVPIGYSEEIEELYYRNYLIENELRELGFPLSVVGINRLDSKVVAGLGLALALPAASSRDRIRVLDGICIAHLGADAPNDRIAVEAWAERTLATLATDRKFQRDDPGLQRAALYAKLGLSTPDWLAAFLPPVDLEAVAKKLASPLGPYRKPPHKLARIGNAIGNWFKQLPDWLLMTLIVGFIALLGYFIIGLMVVGVKFAWGLIW